MSTSDLPYKVKIIWGANPTSVENTDFKPYEFATIDELIAFLKGCTAALGYTDYAVIDPNTYLNINHDNVYPSEREYRIVHDKLILSDRVINYET